MGDFRRVSRLVLSGYYGFRNSGDEAVLKSILTALETAGREAGMKVEPIVLSGDPEWTSRQYGVEAVHRTKLSEVWKTLKSSDGLISGGGSLLQDATGLGSIPYYLGIMEMARWCGKPTFVYAQGIGPVNRKMFQPFIKRAFRKSAYVSVRDEESAILLRRYGVPQGSIEVVPDPVMGLPSGGGHEGSAEELDAQPSSRSGGASLGAEAKLRGSAAAIAEETDTRPIVGVSVRFWRSDRADLVRAAAALEALAGRHAVRLRFLPFHHGADEDASRYVMERLSGAPATLAPAHDDPQQMLREVGRCALLIGMRLHSLIYAANQHVPLLGLSYDPKIDQFLGRLGQRAVGTTDELDPDELAGQAAKILRNPEHWRENTNQRIDRLKLEASQPAQQIIDYIRNK
ncbi:polysaccharide pyruvyl transferase CsaB [Cohnella sp.]|uniref:polysaccharide pyruvyl transferase CsaB n=1 Tax=Cohnella sp. TaxID=1883426 RepID=UPI00356772CE